ncbi:MGMT family protein [Lysobacter xanthus]
MTPGTNDAAERIFDAIRAIPRGEVAGYGEVARRAGLPGRARLVARLLATGDAPGLPWHRVLRSDGRIALPPGSDGFLEQCARLRADGVAVVDGRVKVAARPRAATLDEALWGPPG